MQHSSPQRYWALKRLASEFKTHRGAVIWVVLLGTLVSLVQPFCAKLTEKVVDDLQAGMHGDFLSSAPFILIVAFLVSGLAKYFYNVIRRTISQEVVCRLRERLFEKFVHFPLTSMNKKRTGDMLSSIQNDLVQVDAGMELACDLIKEPVAFMGLLGVAFYCNWKLALATMVVAPIAGLFFSRSGQAVKRYTTHVLSRFSDLISLSQESLVGAHIVKVFQLENPLTEKFKRIQNEYFHNLRKSIRIQELPTPAVELIGSLLMAAVLAYGAYQISIGAMTSGQLIAFVIAIGLAQMPLKKLNGAFIKMKIAEAAAERIYTLLDTQDLENQTKGKRLTEFKDRISFDRVALQYGEKTALEEISFDVKCGECVAFVGFSGGGKTSIVNLLPRLYRATQGSITIDGVPLNQVRLQDLRSLISFVTQDTFLFNDTIFENIRYGNPYATNHEIERAARLAHCDQFISRFPEGFETRVGERGAQLSGGERQRVAIARALLKNAPILVLDEATSSLDSRSEAMVQDALESLMEGRTTFMVAHRFSTVRRASRIYVIEEGKLKESGTHQDLVAFNGIYSKLFAQQQGVGLQ